MNAIMRGARHAFFLACLLTIGMLCGMSASSTAYAQDDHQAAVMAVDDEKPAYSAISKVLLNRKSAVIRNDGQVRFEASLKPSAAGTTVKNPKVKWTISDRKVASITQTGIVQGKRTGTALVTAKAGNGKKATAKVKVVVNANDMAEAIPILTYHRIASDEAAQACYQGQNLTIPASMFERQMRWLKRKGFRTIGTDELRDWRVNGAFLPKKSVLITIDDGFYETYHVAYPILKKHRLKATSFVIGMHVKAKTRKYNPFSNVNHYLGWDAIRKVRAEYPNLEFQSHTYNMHQRTYDGNGVAKSWSREMIDADFTANDQFGFSAIAYPFGHTSKNMTAAAHASKSIKMGFGYMMSWPATRTSPRYNMPRFKVMGDGNMRDFANIANTAR